MGVMDKFITYMKLNGDEDDEYIDDDYYDEEEEVEEQAPRRPSILKKQVEEPEEEESAPKRSPMGGKITSIDNRTSSRRNVPRQGMQVCVIKPISVEESREITETLLSNRTVVLNLEGLEVEIAQRIIDFTSGSCFAIGGNLQMISSYIFIVTPANVDISGDFQELLGGAFGMPFNNN